MKIKKGDNVIVITGADKGKIGKVLDVYKDEGRVLVDNVGMKKKHQKSRRGGQKGQIIEKSSPIDISNVMILDPKKNVRSRISISRQKGTVVRIAKKSGAVIEK